MWASDRCKKTDKKIFKTERDALKSAKDLRKSAALAANHTNAHTAFGGISGTSGRSNAAAISPGISDLLLLGYNKVTIS